MRRRGNIFVLATGENVNSNNVSFRVAVLSSLRRRVIDNLARESFDDDVRAFLQGTLTHSKRRQWTKYNVRRRVTKKNNTYISLHIYIAGEALRNIETRLEY